MTTTSERDLLPPTNEDTLGPYFPISFAEYFSADLTCIHPGLVTRPEGQEIVLKGSVFDRHGELAHGALLEFWQANAKGIYRNPNSADHPDLDPGFDGFARIRTADGHFELRTIKPGSWQNRAPNITLTIFSDGISRIVTQLFFADETTNKNDPILTLLPLEDQQRLIAQRGDHRPDGAQEYRINIIMAGENETPFFDDLES